MPNGVEWKGSFMPQPGGNYHQLRRSVSEPLAEAREPLQREVFSHSAVAVLPYPEVDASAGQGMLQRTLNTVQDFVPQMFTRPLKVMSEGWRSRNSDVHDPEPFMCMLCCEDAQGRAHFKQCRNSDHYCCRDCMGRYVSGLVNEGRVGAIRCPMNEACEAFVESAEVLEWTDPDIFARYERFRKMQANPTLRQCPKCAELCSPLKDEEAGIIIPEIRCNNCNWEFCYYHSNAHLGKPCTALMAEQDGDERMAIALSMEEQTHVCPSCSILTQKSSGCNHMTCRQCQCEWCWVCGDKIDSVWSHYSADNPKGCTQFGSLLGDAGQERNPPPAWFTCVFCLFICLLICGVCYGLWYACSSHILVNLVIVCCCCCFANCTSSPRARNEAGAIAS